MQVYGDNGMELPFSQDGVMTIVLDEPYNGTVYYGTRMFNDILFSPINTRDASGVIQSASKLRIQSYDITLTGACKATAYATWNNELDPDGWPSVEWNGAEVGVSATTDSPAVQRATWRLPWKHDSQDARLALTAGNALSLNIHSIEWNGQYYKAGRRF